MGRSRKREIPIMDTITRFDRRELKFVVRAEQADAIRTAVAARMAPDPHAGPDGRYPIISLYLDNAERAIYVNNLLGRPSRRKLRIRIYGQAGDHPEGITFVEIKHKYTGRTSKRRISLTIEEALDLTRGRPFARRLVGMDAIVLEEVQRLIIDKDLRPVCVMRYDREAWMGRGAEADLRLTFDAGLKARARTFHQVVPDDHDFDVDLVPPDQRVLEVKVDHAVPYWLARLLGGLGCQPRSFSKYQTAVEALAIQPHGMSIDLPQDWTIGLAGFAGGDRRAVPGGAAGKAWAWIARPTQ
jgi:hypothetical protein